MDEKIKLYSEFEQLCIPHMDTLYNFALRMTGGKKIAAKLLKETYSKAFWFFEKLEKGTNYKIWLFRVMRNAYLNSYSRKPGEPIESEMEKLYESIKISKEGLLLTKEIYYNMTDAEISDALSSLPEDFRILIILCDIEKFIYEEIADFVDLPVGVVTKRMHRARIMLFAKIYISKKVQF